MKKFKPNLKKMFGFHTIVVLAVFVVLQSQTIEGRLQTKHNHFSHNNNNNQHYNYHNNDVKQHHRKNHHHHQQQQLQQPTTPSIELTHSSTAVNADNEFLVKQHILKDVLSQNETYKSITSTTSSSSSSSSSASSTILFSSHLTEQTDLNTQHVSSNLTTSTIASPTLSNYVKEHTYYNEYNKIFPTPMPTRHIGNHRLNNSTSRYSNPDKSSKFNLATVDQVTNEQQQQQHNQQHNYSTKQEYDNEQQPQPYDDDYYEDYGEDYSDVVDDTDATSDEDDNSLSDRSYARITRSKLDDDYADDEPYRSDTNDLQMQRDAAPGVLTEQKYSEVGSEKAVLQARDRYIQEQKRPRTPHELATAHWHRMIQATKCRKPFPRVIPVSNNTSKHYEPYATILHRCGEDTGCCGSTASVCTVKRYEIVMVYVFSYDFNYRKEIEALPMQNHTECHCVNRGSLLHDSMPRGKRSGGAGVGGGYVHQFHRLKKQQQQQQQTQDAVANNNFHHYQHNFQNVLGCHCPRHFNVFEEDVERHAHLPRPHSVFTRKCRCDCLINNQTCLRFKHGDEGFSLEDRKCILEHNCKTPVCSYGDYNLRIGRCPGHTSHLSQMI